MFASKLYSASSPCMARNMLSLSSSVKKSSSVSYTKSVIQRHQFFYKQSPKRPLTTSKNGKLGSAKLGETSANTSVVSKESQKTFLQRWMAHKEIPPRGTLKWYGEMTLLCTVFAITGTSTMVLVRPAVSEVLGLKGSLKDGPWSYRICSLVIMTPLYAGMLVVVGVSLHLKFEPRLVRYSSVPS